MQSLMHLPCTNPLYSLEMIRGVIEANMLAKILDKILNLKFVRAIGLNISIESTILTLGKRIMALAL